MKLNRHIREFAKAIGTGAIEIYNEFSLQHELGLRFAKQPKRLQGPIERNVSHFKLAKSGLEKREIDIAVTSRRSGAQTQCDRIEVPEERASSRINV